MTICVLARTACAAALAFALAAAHAAAQSSPCDDHTYARDFKVHFAGEVDRVYAAEQSQRAAWNARAEAIGRQLVVAGAMTQDGQANFRLAVMKRPDIAALDAQIAQASEDFRERNNSLQGVALISPLDPMRPYRAWCVVASSALESLKSKLAIEGQQWQMIDQALLAGAASKGVRFAP